MATLPPSSQADLDATLRPNFIAGNIIVALAAIAAVALHIVARRIKGLRLAADDYTIFVALVRS